jgi:MFS family permease
MTAVLAARSDQNERLIAAALGLAATTASVIASGAAAAWMLLPLMAIMGFGVGTSGPNRDLLVRRAATSRFGRTAFGRVYGFVYSGLDTGLAVSPVLFGPLLDAGDSRHLPHGGAAGRRIAPAWRVGTSARVQAREGHGDRQFATTGLPDAHEPKSNRPCGCAARLLCPVRQQDSLARS